MVRWGDSRPPLPSHSYPLNWKPPRPAVSRRERFVSDRDFPFRVLLRAIERESRVLRAARKDNGTRNDKIPRRSRSARRSTGSEFQGVECVLELVRGGTSSDEREAAARRFVRRRSITIRRPRATDDIFLHVPLRRYPPPPLPLVFSVCALSRCDYSLSNLNSDISDSTNFYETTPTREFAKDTREREVSLSTITDR